MKYKSARPEKKDDEPKKEPLPPYSTKEGFEGPVPLRKVERTKRSTRRQGNKINQNVFEDEFGRKINVRPYRQNDLDKRFYENKGPKKSLRAAATYEASPHSIWLRRDIWAALKLYAEVTDRSLRSCAEEALYNFLLKEGRVTETEDLGEEERNSSWVTNED